MRPQGGESGRPEATRVVTTLHQAGSPGPSKHAGGGQHGEMGPGGWGAVWFQGKTSEGTHRRGGQGLQVHVHTHTGPGDAGSQGNTWSLPLSTAPLPVCSMTFPMRARTAKEHTEGGGVRRQHGAKPNQPPRPGIFPWLWALETQQVVGVGTCWTLASPSAPGAWGQHQTPSPITIHLHYLWPQVW